MQSRPIVPAFKHLPASERGCNLLAPPIRYYRRVPVRVVLRSSDLKRTFHMWHCTTIPIEVEGTKRTSVAGQTGICKCAVKAELGKRHCKILPCRHIGCVRCHWPDLRFLNRVLAGLVAQVKWNNPDAAQRLVDPARTSILRPRACCSPALPLHACRCSRAPADPDHPDPDPRLSLHFNSTTVFIAVPCSVSVSGAVLVSVSDGPLLLDDNISVPTHSCACNST